MLSWPVAGLYESAPYAAALQHSNRAAIGRYLTLILPNFYQFAVVTPYRRTRNSLSPVAPTLLPAPLQIKRFDYKWSNDIFAGIRAVVEFAHRVFHAEIHRGAIE
jgi:hypothetical protein